MKLYVIGPVSGIKDNNIHEFELIQQRLQAGGYDCDIPHDFISSGASWKEAIHISLNRLTRYELGAKDRFIPEYDGVAMLDGWTQSQGAMFETDVCVVLGIPCKAWREWL